MAAWPTADLLGSFDGRGGLVRHVSLAFLIAVAAGCGRLGNPDLREGRINGRLVDAVAGSYVYAYGAPLFRAEVAAGGEYRLDAPAGTQAIVIVEPPPQGMSGLGRAALVKLQGDVGGAEEYELEDQYGELAPPDKLKLPLAGAVVATVSEKSGAVCRDPVFVVEGTDRSGPKNAGTSPVTLSPLPEGNFDLSVQVAGFKRNSIKVSVVAGETTTAPLEVDVDDTAAVKGCEEAGCEGGLACRADGRCE